MRYLVLFFILLINGGSFAQVVLLSQTSHHFICVIFSPLVAHVPVKKNASWYAETKKNWQYKKDLDGRFLYHKQTKK